ncbi:hypothetical protein, partial [[Flexibacter] sp. ATCC 35208]|uniref:hypothetical protein n=1 Tax=[Flexibacter] sp. ATCC 35208 TaxID=1936242 RepID=UPI001C6FCB16
FRKYYFAFNSSIGNGCSFNLRIACSIFFIIKGLLRTASSGMLDLPTINFPFFQEIVKFL